MTENDSRDQTPRGASPLRDRVALVTGAASGIGAATVSTLLAEGVRVHGIDIREHAPMTDGAPGGVERDRFQASVVDVSSDAEVAAAVTSTVRLWGQLDIAIACHGLNSVDDDDIASLDMALYERILSVNLGGAVHLAKHAAPHLCRSEAGVYLAVSSIGALRAPAGPAYAASKAGILGLIRVLAFQWASSNVRAVGVTPGPVDTEMMQRSLRKRGLTAPTLPPGALQRVAQPSEVAALIRFLVSDDASYITGTAVTIDGGVSPF